MHVHYTYMVSQAQALQQQQGQQQGGIGGVPGQHDVQSMMMPRMSPRDSLRGSPPFPSIGRGDDQQQYPGVHPPDGASFPSAPFPSFDLRYLLLHCIHKYKDVLNACF
jgi:hypothetical protein